MPLACSPGTVPTLILQKTQPIWSGERRAALRAADAMVPQVNAVLHDLLANIPPICAGYVVDHVANLSRLERTPGTLLGTWEDALQSARRAAQCGRGCRTGESVRHRAAA